MAPPPERRERSSRAAPGTTTPSARADALQHLAALDLVYDGVVTSHRDAIDATEEPDPVSQDMLIDQAHELEQFQWFIRAHLEGTGGRLATAGTNTLTSAAKRAAPRR